MFQINQQTMRNFKRKLDRQGNFLHKNLKLQQKNKMNIATGELIILNNHINSDIPESREKAF